MSSWRRRYLIPFSCYSMLSLTRLALSFAGRLFPVPYVSCSMSWCLHQSLQQQVTLWPSFHSPLYTSTIPSFEVHPANFKTNHLMEYQKIREEARSVTSVQYRRSRTKQSPERKKVEQPQEDGGSASNSTNRPARTTGR